MMNRRQCCLSTALIATASLVVASPSLAAAERTTTTKFRSLAYSSSEYTNSIIASRDTNVSPREVYADVMLNKIPRAPPSPSSRALDVGCGAGVSTQVLFEELGYHTIDCCDWSNVAWNLNVVECPTSSVHFYNLDDERFLEEWKSNIQSLYDVIVFHFAVNRDKAELFATQLLKRDGSFVGTGQYIARLLAKAELCTTKQRRQHFVERGRHWGVECAVSTRRDATDVFGDLVCAL